MGETLLEHLSQFGLRHFMGDEYWAWASAQLPGETAEQLNVLRKPVVEGKATATDQLRFYDYIATPAIAAVVHSLKSDAIAASGQAVNRHLHAAKAVLDLGCGIGYLTTWYARQDPRRHALGVDISAPSIMHARQWADQLGVTNVRFLQRDISAELPSGPWDAIIDTQTVYYLPQWDGALAQIRANLAPQGVFISVSPLGTQAEAEEFVHALEQAGLVVRRFEWARHFDGGEAGAYPVIVAAATGPACRLNLAEEYARLMQEIQGIASPGAWTGRIWEDAMSKESEVRAEAHAKIQRGLERFAAQIGLGDQIKIDEDGWHYFETEQGMARAAAMDIDDRTYFIAESPVFRLPPDKGVVAAMMEDALRLNFDLYGDLRVGLRDGALYAIAKVPADEIADEMYGELITKVLGLAEEYRRLLTSNPQGRAKENE